MYLWQCNHFNKQKFLIFSNPWAHSMRDNHMFLLYTGDKCYKDKVYKLLKRSIIHK